MLGVQDRLVDLPSPPGDTVKIPDRERAGPGRSGACPGDRRRGLLAAGSTAKTLPLGAASAYRVAHNIRHAEGTPHGRHRSRRGIPREQVVKSPLAHQKVAVRTRVHTDAGSVRCGAHQVPLTPGLAGGWAAPAIVPAFAGDTITIVEVDESPSSAELAARLSEATSEVATTVGDHRNLTSTITES